MARDACPPRRGGAVALLAAAALVLGGCGGGTAGPETGADVADIQEEPGDDRGHNLVDEFEAVESYAGQQVTVSAEVSEIVGPHAFTITGETGEPLLIVHDGSAEITLGTPVRVVGTVVQTFELVEAEDFAEADLNDESFSPYADIEPYIQATVIETDPEFGNG